MQTDEIMDVQPALQQADVLRSCPFCGGEAQLKRYARNGWEVRCRKCLIGLKQKTIRHTLDWLKQKMIESWNARA